MRASKYTVKPTLQFKKDDKLAMKRGLDISLLEDIIAKLALGESLPECSCYIEKHNKTRQGQPAPPLFRTAEGR